MDVAQLVEHCPEEAGVAGSNPAVHTRGLTHEGFFIKVAAVEIPIQFVFRSNTTSR